MRVLIVEDEVRLAETLRDLLELERYTADICHDGESGLDNALSDIYDLVILDVMLPKKDGFSAAAGGENRPGADALGPFGACGPGGGAGLRCGLLPHQAL
mgnify:CR=1 FL=1